jgi:hypothetical protein
MLLKNFINFATLARFSHPMKRLCLKSMSSRSRSSRASSDMSSNYMIGIAIAVVVVIAIVIVLCWCRTASCATACLYTAAQLSDRVHVMDATTAGATSLTTGSTPTFQTVTANTTSSISCVNGSWFRLTSTQYAASGKVTVVASTAATAPTAVPADTMTIGYANSINILRTPTPTIYWTGYYTSSASGVYDIPLPAGFTLTSDPIFVWVMKH